MTIIAWRQSSRETEQPGTEQENPLYFRELPTDGPFCDREKDLDDLCRHERSLANVVLFSPRPQGGAARALQGVFLGLAPRQIALLKALAKEPTPALYSRDYVRRHRLASGGVRYALKRLTSLDLVQRGEGEIWRLVDPVMAAWLV